MKTRYSSPMIQHTLIAIIIFTIAIFAILGYQKYVLIEVQVAGGSYTEGIIGTPRFINPVLAQSTADKDLTELIFGSLIDVDQNGNVSYHIADSLTVSEDQRVYTLRINPDARFSDGTHVDSEDIAFTVRKIQSPTIKSPLYNSWAGVEVTTTSAREVTFSLSQPYADFIHNLSIGVLPEHIWRDVPDTEFVFNINNIQPIGSGFYYNTAIEFNSDGTPQSYSLEPNPYTVSDPYISKVTIQFYDDPSELLEAYEKGNIDGAYGVSAMEDYDTNKIQTGALPRSFALFFNTENDDLLDTRTRKALSYMINRQQIVDDVFFGYADKVTDPVGTRELDITFSSQEAVTRLENAGWRQNSEGVFFKSISGRNTPLTFSMAVPDIDEVLSVADIIVSNARDIGVTIQTEVYTQAELTNEVIRSRDFDALLFGYVHEKPSDAFAFWHSSQKNDPGLNISVYSDPQADAALSNLRNQQEREDDIEVFLDQWSEDTPAIFLYSPNYIYLAPAHFNIPHSINDAADRFNMIDQWYQETRHVWGFLVRNTEE